MCKSLAIEALSRSYSVLRGIWYAENTGYTSNFKTLQRTNGKETVSQKTCYILFLQTFCLRSLRPCWGRYFLLLCVCEILTPRTSHLNSQEVEGAQGAKGCGNSGKASCKLQVAVPHISYLGNQYILPHLSCSPTDRHRLPDTGLALCALLGNSKLMGSLSFEPLPGMFSIRSGEGRESTLFDIGIPGEEPTFQQLHFVSSIY